MAIACEGVGRLSAAPSVSNHTVIVMQSYRVDEPTMAFSLSFARSGFVAGGRRAWLASEALAGGRLSAAPSVSNHEVIMM